MNRLQRICSALSLTLLCSCSTDGDKQPQTPSTVRNLTTAISAEDWDLVAKLVGDKPHGHESLRKWKANPIRVKSLVSVEKDEAAKDGATFKYSFRIENKDRTLNPHWLQISARAAGNTSIILDCWEFGW